MAWSEPIKNIKANPSVPNVTLRLQDTQGGLRLVVSVTKALFEKMGLPTRADMMLGTETDEGKIRIAFNREGQFAWSQNGKRGKSAGATMQLPLPPGVPEMAIRGVPCEFFEADEDQLIVGLPLSGWRAAVKPTRSKAA